MAKEAFYKEAIDTLVNHDKDAAEDVAKRAIAAGVSPQDIMQKGFVVGIRKVGDAYQEALLSAGYDRITTEIRPAGLFYYAEEDHQQYLAKNPGGYCGLGGIRVACPVGLGVTG